MYQFMFLDNIWQRTKHGVGRIKMMKGSGNQSLNMFSLETDEGVLIKICFPSNYKNMGYIVTVIAKKSRCDILSTKKMWYLVNKKDVIYCH